MTFPELPDIDSAPDDPDEWYGVWLSGQGWLKRDDIDGRIFATLNIHLARQQARWFGGKVLIIDASLKDFEGQMLQAERERQRKKVWRIWTR